MAHTAKSVEQLWSKRNILTYPDSYVLFICTSHTSFKPPSTEPSLKFTPKNLQPQVFLTSLLLSTIYSNISTDSSDSLFCNPNLDNNTYIGSSNRGNIIRFNDLLPPLTKSGEIGTLPSFALSTFQPKHTIQTESIQVHIQFTDRSYDVIQDTLHKTTNHRNYQIYKKKKQRFTEMVNNPKIRQSKRIRNKLEKEIFHFDTSSNGHKKKKTTKNKKPKPKQPPKPPTPKSLNLPKLEPRKRAVSEDSVSSMSVSLDVDTNQNTKKRKAQKMENFEERPNKKRKLNGSASHTTKIIDNDVIGDSEDDIFDETQPQNSLIYDISLDDFKLDFFLSLFPQLLVTHHLVYCMNSYQHYYYQSYFSSDKNQYEWIQTDSHLTDIFHRYIDDHFAADDDDNEHKVDYNVNSEKFKDYQNRKIVLFFQIRPRADTYTDTCETIEHHNDLLLDNLYEINGCGEEGDDIDEENAMIYIEDDSDFDEDIPMDSCEDSLVSNVIKAIIDQEMNGLEEVDESEKDAVVPGSWESGLCALCERKFSSNKCNEEEWIECDECNLWYHVMCSGLSNRAFAQFQNGDKHKKYKCLMCNEKETGREI